MPPCRQPLPPQAGNREFWPFVNFSGTLLKNGQVVEKPTIANHFHGLEKHLFTLMRACSEYLNEIAATPDGESIDFPEEFMEKAERNIDLAWLVHFLYDYAFLYLDLRQSIRGNCSKKIDLLWREFVPFARLSIAHKTQYLHRLLIDYSTRY